MKALNTIMFVVICIFLRAGVAGAEVSVAYLYNLSDFNGVIPYSSAKLVADNARNETYVMSGDEINVFNASGMEVFRFNHDARMGAVYDMAVKEDGRILMLVYREGRSLIQECNYRGETQTVIELKNIPAEFADLMPNRLVYRAGRIYLAGLGSMKVVVTAGDGTFLKGYDVATLTGIDEKSRADNGLGSFSIDPDGNLLFTQPVVARAYRLSPEGTPVSFGKRGSGPGKFGVPEGIAADREGNIYVTDKLRCMVLVFDKDLKFIKEFGHRGFNPGNLIGPNEIVTNLEGKVFVSQLRSRGVSVYKVSFN